MIRNHCNIGHKILAYSFAHWYNLERATVAQMVEQTIRNRPVKGSTPFGGSNFNVYLGEDSTIIVYFFITGYQFLNIEGLS